MNRLLKCVITSIFMLVAAASVAAQTKIRLHDVNADVSGYRSADLLLGPSNTTSVTNTVSSGTDIQLTKTAGGSTMQWITPPFVSGFTLSGTVTCNIYGGESATSANTAFRCRLYKYTGGSEGAAILTANMTTELNATTTTVRNWTGTPTSTAFSAGDRLVIKLFIENCATSGCPTGTMAGSQTVTARYDGPTDGANSASWVQINETQHFALVGNPSTETLTIDPSVTAGHSSVGDASVTLTCTDSLTTGICRAAGAIETHLTTDSASTASAGRNVSESLTTTPSVGVTAGRIANPVVNLTTTPSATVSNVGVRSVSESHTTSASVSVQRSMNVGASPCSLPACSIPFLGVGENFDSTNYIPHSQEFENATWEIGSVGDNGAADPGPPTVTANTQAAPNATTTAETITFPNTQDSGSRNKVSWIAHDFSPTVFSAGYWTFSVYLKAAAPVSAGIELYENGQGNNSFIVADVTTSWKRFSVTVAAAGIGTLFADVYSSEFPATTVYAWGAQLQKGISPGPYVVTGANAVSIPIDSVSESTNGPQGAGVNVTLTTSVSVSVVRCAAAGVIETHLTNDSVSAVKFSPTTANPSETVGHSDSASWTINRSVVVTNSLTTSASVATSTFSGNSRGVSESLAVTATVNVTSTHPSNLVENLSTSDSVGVVLCGAIPEFLTESDSVAIKHTILVAVSESLSESDSITTQKTFTKNVVETNSTAASVSLSSPNHVDIAETLFTTTTTLINTALNKNVVETLSESDSVTGTTTKSSNVSESLFTSASVSIQATPHQFAVNLSEFYAVTDSLSVSAPMHLFVNVSNSSSVASFVSTTSPGHVAIVEAHTITDSVAIVAPNNFTALENLTTSDTVDVFRILFGPRKRFMVVDSQ